MGYAQIETGNRHTLEHAPIPEFRPPPFVNELFRAIQPNIITPERFDAIVEESHKHERSAILVRMTRDIDLSGLVANFAGISDNPSEIFSSLKTLGDGELKKIKTYKKVDPKIPQEIFDALTGQRTTLRAVLILDDMQKSVIDKVKILREASPLAMALRTANDNALSNLYRNPEHIQGFGSFLSSAERRKLFSGEPRICYIRSVAENAVYQIQHYFLRPNIESVRFEFEGETKVVSDILSALTPDYYKRMHEIREDSYAYDPKKPEGFIALLGKIGHPLPQFVASYIKKDEALHQQVLNEELATEAVRDLLQRYL